MIREGRVLLLLDYFKLLSALSLSLDILERRNFGHARKVAYVAIRLTRNLNVKRDEEYKIFYSAFLHDIGKSDVYEDFISNNTWMHSLRGSDMVKDMPRGHEFCEIIKYHHENWDGSGYFHINGDSIPFEAQIIYLADQFDVKYNTVSVKMNEYETRKHIEKWLNDESGKSFNPIIVNALKDLMKQEKFWLDYEHYDTFDVLRPYISNETMIVDIDDLSKIARVFSNIIDNKSHFTYKHSKGISEVAYKAALISGYDEMTAKKVRIAGLLHDLGKLAIPNEILDKPDKLTEEEFMIIKSHTYYTKKILMEIGGIDDIAEWAANHHEKLDGSGYPEGLTGEDLDEISRLMAVCDMYQALTEDRPYRAGMSHIEAVNIIYKLVKLNKIDGGSLEIIKEVEL